MRKYGLIGYPLLHSHSKVYFNRKFVSESIDAEYVNFEISSIGKIRQILTNNKDLCGLNVTIPYKEQVIPYCHSLATAKLVGAVNVIKFDRSGKKLRLIGYNTDVIGFQESIGPLLKSHHVKALILGTGGAAKAVCYGLAGFGIYSKFVSRSKKENYMTYSELSPEVIKEYSIIVNTTPMGMYPNSNEAPPIPYRFVTDQHLLYDLTYNPVITQFMRLGIMQGAFVKNGEEMFKLQALHTWNIWNG